METFHSSYAHWGGKLGNYNGKPTSVGSYGSNKVETLSSSGWSTLPDFPKRYLKNIFLYPNLASRIYYHVLMGLPSGSLLLAGGYDGNEYQRAIWLLESGIWSQIGNVQKVNFKNMINSI